MGKAGCESRLRDALQPIREQFDVVLIDCPPALNMLTVNALVAADGVLIPMQCEYYALEGLTALVTRSNRSRPARTRSSRSAASCAPCSTRVTTWPTRSRRS